MLFHVRCCELGRKKKSRSVPKISSRSVAASLQRRSSISRLARSNWRCLSRSVGREIPDSSSVSGGSTSAATCGTASSAAITSAAVAFFRETSQPLSSPTITIAPARAAQTIVTTHARGRTTFCPRPASLREGFSQRHSGRGAIPIPSPFAIRYVLMNGFT